MNWGDLRPYQQRAIGEVRAAVLDGARRILLVAPTGSGKTVTAAALIEGALSVGSSVLVIVHRLELVTQMRDTLARFGVSAGIIRADVPPEPLHRVQVATIQSLVRRDLPRANIVIVDEAHRASSDSYEKVRAAYPDAVYLGLTATPCRENGRPLGDVFERLIEVASYSELIASGHIAEPICYGTPRAPDLSGVHVRGGDYVVGELEQAMNKTELVGGLVENWKKYAEGRRTIVFAVGVAHSRAIEAAFSGCGIRAAHLDGTTEEDERARVLHEFARGNVDVLCNCALFIEGLDIPSAKCAVLARPTKSLALYMQGVGRILRPWEGVAPIVLDHAGNLGRHGLPHEDREWSLDGPARRKSLAPHKTCPSCFGYIAGGARECPLCGHSFVVAAANPKELPKEVAQTLVRIDAGLARKDAERLHYDELVERARRMGFKPGFAAAKWKEKFGRWPPWAWSTETKAAFANDGQWQSRQSKREVEREHWQAVKARQEQPVAAEELDEDLTSWLEKFG